MWDTNHHVFNLEKKKLENSRELTWGIEFKSTRAGRSNSSSADVHFAYIVHAGSICCFRICFECEQTTKLIGYSHLRLFFLPRIFFLLPEFSKWRYPCLIREKKKKKKARSESSDVGKVKTGLLKKLVLTVVIYYRLSQSTFCMNTGNLVTCKLLQSAPVLLLSVSGFAQVRLFTTPPFCKNKTWFR